MPRTSDRSGRPSRWVSEWPNQVDAPGPFACDESTQSQRRIKPGWLGCQHWQELGFTVRQPERAPPVTAAISPSQPGAEIS